MRSSDRDQQTARINLRKVYQQSVTIMPTQLKTRLAFCLTCLSLLLATVAIAQAQEGSLVVETNQHQVRFGDSIQFQLTVSGPADITSAILTYRTADNQGMTVERLNFSPAPRVELIQKIDMNQRPLKPFVTVEYWWTVNDAAGHQLTTEHQKFSYEDNRFAWQSLPGRQAAVHWYEGDIAFGSQALDVAEQAVDRIREMIDPSLSLPAPLHLYLYANETDLLPALPATGREWVIGQAYPELRLAVVSIPPGPESTSNMRWLIPHELTHLLFYEVMGSSYGRLPPWLNEGLAVVSEQSLDPDDALVLDQAFQDGQLISLDLLCYNFFREDDRVRLAYAQSASVVRFIQENYGYSAIGRLVAAYRDGLSCQAGVRRALGISLGSLESQWQESLGTRSPNMAFLKKAAPWLLLVLSSLPLLLLIAHPLRARRTEQPRERIR